MAIATLTNIDKNKYRGGGSVTAYAGLATDIYDIVAKVNEVLALYDGDTLEVGDGAAAGEYYGGSASWFSVDGVNPPSFEKLRMQDQTTGHFVVVSVAGGSLVVT